MERYGLSVHQAAALALARRLLGCREGIPRRRTAPLDNGGHVTFSVPVRKRVKHCVVVLGSHIAAAEDRRLQRSIGGE